MTFHMKGETDIRIQDEAAFDLVVALDLVPDGQQHSAESIKAALDNATLSGVAFYFGAYSALQNLNHSVLVEYAKVMTGITEEARSTYVRDQDHEIKESVTIKVDKFISMTNRDLRIEIIRAWNRKIRP